MKSSDKGPFMVLRQIFSFQKGELESCKGKVVTKRIYIKIRRMAVRDGVLNDYTRYRRKAAWPKIK